MAGDYVPHKDGAFLEWAKTLISFGAPKLAEYNIPLTGLDAIQGLLSAYETAFNVVQDPNHGKVDNLSKTTAKEALMKAMRVFVRSYLSYNPLVSAIDKGKMGLPLHNDIRTPTSAPTTVPELELDSSGIRQISVHFKDAGSENRGKPPHIHGVELRWALLENPPSSVEDLTKSAFDTASPYTFAFDESDRGKSLYICPRWENNKGDKGPMGEIVRAIVP